MAKQKGPADFRNSESGRFVKKGFADKHPRTTEKEHNRGVDKGRTPGGVAGRGKKK